MAFVETQYKHIVLTETNVPIIAGTTMKVIGTDAPLVLNDIYRAATEVKLKSSDVQKVRKKLSQYRYEEWRLEE